MFNRSSGPDGRHRGGTPYMNPNVTGILKKVEEETKDPTLSQSVYFGPTAMTHIRRLIEMGGTIITDTVLLANDINSGLLGDHGTQIVCFIDDPHVVYLAEQRHVTRAEVAVDYGLALTGPKLMVVGSAPAAINRIICVLAAPTGFASVVQMKERLMDSDLTSIVVRGKKGGVQTTAALLNAILRDIAENPNG